MKLHRNTAFIVLVLLFFTISVFCAIYGEDYSRYDGTPAAIPVLSPEEAVKANEEAIGFYKQRQIEANALAVTTIEVAPPIAVPVLSPEEAVRANEEAIRFQRNKAIAKAFQSFIHKIGLNNNRIHFILSLLPLLLILPLRFKKKDKRNSKVSKYFSLSRRMRVLFSVSLLAFGVLVFVPWSVYFGNSPQFTFIFQDFVNWNLRVLTLSIVGASIILLLIPPIVSDYLISIIAGLGLCVYVQAMFMNQHLGTMDGIEPFWSEHRVFGTINLIIWIAIILSPIVLRKIVPSVFSQVISMATGIVLFLELLAIVSMVFSANQDVWLRTADTYYTDGSEQFQLSKEKNVVVFVFDTLGSEYVERCFETYPEAKEIVKDFIWYKEARANYAKTFPGLSHELTGTMLPAPANNYYELLEKMWHSSAAKSFYKQISDAGYDTRLYCGTSKFLIGPEDNFHNYFSNIKPKMITRKIDYECLHYCLKIMSLYSFTPFFLKKYFFYAFNFSNNVVQEVVDDIPSDKKRIPVDNPGILKKMTTSSGLTTSADKPTLSFYYSYGVHRPWYIDEKCNRVDTPFDNPCPTSRSCFYVLSEFIRLLKEANIYDNTALLVCSDHGGNDVGLNAGNGKYDLTFMIKPFHENKAELSIDEAKVQSIDILPTLLYMACGEKADFKDFEGFIPNSIPNERVRYVYCFGRDSNLPPVDTDFSNLYGTYNAIEEYIFSDIDSFKLGNNSKSFVRLIPLVMTTEKNK